MSVTMRTSEVKLKADEDGAEDVADGGRQQSEDGDDHDCNQDENERVLKQSLTFFTGSKKHDVSPLSKVDYCERL